MFKLIELDNPTSAGADFIGKVDTFKYDGTRFYFNNLYSSRVKTIIHDEYSMVVTTKNSIYTFMKVPNA